jgi:hypothetical protein
MATPENPRVRLNTRTLGPFGHAKVAPFPQPCLGAYKGTLWGPVSEIAGTQVPVAGNSNLRFGDTPGPLGVGVGRTVGTNTTARPDENELVTN